MILVGPFPYELHDWRSFEKRFPNRVFALGPKLPSELHQLMLASDLYLDSFPMSGGTALSDAVMAGVPCLTMESVTGQLDFTLDTKSYCRSIDEFHNKAAALLQDPQLAESYEKELKAAMLNSSGIYAWTERIKAVYAQLPLKHSIQHFKSNPDSNDALTFYTSLFHSRKKYLVRVPDLFSIYHTVKSGKRKVSIELNFF